MNKNKSLKTSVNNRDTLQSEYDFSKAVRCVTAKRYAEGTNVVVINNKTFCFCLYPPLSLLSL